MQKITFPGKLGDLLWALPTIRHHQAVYGPHRLYLSAHCRPLLNLLMKQPYLGGRVTVDPDWVPPDTAPMRPVPPDSVEDIGLCLGYSTWPRQPLPFELAHNAGYNPAILPAEYWRPWIHAEPFPPDRLTNVPRPVVLFHWTDRWFELKLGLTEILSRNLGLWTLLTSDRSARWPIYPHARAATLENVARWIATASLVVTDNSCVMVLCAAMGTRCVVVEPEHDRHHPIFWPGSTQDERGRWQQADNPFGRLIYPVLGVDGKPTFDARHTKDLIQQLLKEGA